MSRRVLRLEMELPDLAPAQAELLWRLLAELAQSIWEAYEPEIFDFESERFASKSDERSADEPEPSRVDPPRPQPLPTGNAPDTDF